MPEPVTHVAILTPPGRGAIAVVALRGARALELVKLSFQPVAAAAVAEWPCGLVRFGRWRQTSEEVVAVRIKNDELEIHSHGGLAASAAIVASLVSHGATRVSLEEWATVTEPDTIRAEAALALAQATTERTAAILLGQYQGALRSAIEHISGRMEAGQSDEAAAELDELLSRGELGRRLTTPWAVVLVGKPNAGKSSLLNALLGFGRAITHQDPGTTRDVIRATAAVSGWPIDFFDTAGLRTAEGEIERAGIAAGRRQLAAADAAIWLIDTAADPAAQPLVAPDEPLPSRILKVWNKCDLARPPRPLGDLEIAVSAKTGDGLDVLQAAIVRLLIPAPPQRGAAVPFTTRQIELLARALKELHAGKFAAASATLRSI